MNTQRRLILLRHAKSDRPVGVADLDRPLDKRGQTDALRIGAYLAAENLVPDLALVSPAQRTAETWKGLSVHLTSTRMETVPLLYDAPARRILDAVHSALAEAKTVLVIGHNPGLAELAILLTSKGLCEARAAMHEKFPTAALAVINCEADSWDALDVTGGVLERFVTPRSLGLRSDVQSAMAHLDSPKCGAAQRNVDAQGRTVGVQLTRTAPGVTCPAASCVSRVPLRSLGIRAWLGGFSSQAE